MSLYMTQYMTQRVHGQHCVDSSASNQTHEHLQPKSLSQVEQSRSLLPAKTLVFTSLEFKQVNQVSQQGSTEQHAGSVQAARFYGHTYLHCM